MQHDRHLGSKQIPVHGQHSLAAPPHAEQARYGRQTEPSHQAFVRSHSHMPSPSQSASPSSHWQDPERGSQVAPGGQARDPGMQNPPGPQVEVSHALGATHWGGATQVAPSHVPGEHASGPTQLSPSRFADTQSGAPVPLVPHTILTQDRRLVGPQSRRG